MAKAKNDIKLVSSANTGFFYVTKKNPKNNTNKLELKKYDPVVRKHVVFKEGKIKESKKSLSLWFCGSPVVSNELSSYLSRWKYLRCGQARPFGAVS